MRTLRLPTLFAALALIGCGDDSTGPAGIEFPDLPSGLLAAYCVVGERQPSQAISGTVSNTDCQLSDSSYYEVWRVRVATAGNYQFAATSTFDNFISVLRLESYSGSSATLSTLAFDDDSGPGTNGLLTASLQPNTDYFFVVNGYSQADVGPYTATITAQ